MADRIKYKIKGHEKFPLRDGWLSKGIFAVHNNSKVFTGIYATDELGVGSNMVKSIKYWMQAFGLLEKKNGNDANSLVAEMIKEKDPYLEDDFTLWILHSHIAKNIEFATTWYMFFNKFDADEFSKEDTLKKMCMEIKNYTAQNIPENSVKDDVDVLLNMYSKEHTHNIDPEDKIVCPLSSLGLIRKNGDLYSKNQPELRRLDDFVILYEISCRLEKEQSINIDSISTGAESLGAIYNLTRVTINQYLDRLEAQGYIRVDRTAGLDMIYPINVPNPIKVIENYYLNK